jgi:acetyl esterase/lipase
VNLGVRWLKAHAAEFNGRARVGVMGNSSGGHLGALVALRPRDPRYAALPLVGNSDLDATVAYVLALWPVIDPLYRYRYMRERGKQSYIDAHHAYWTTEEAMAEGSPQTVIDNEDDVELPPMLMFLKKDDTSHPIEMQERFIASYRKRGGEIQVEVFDDQQKAQWIAQGTYPMGWAAMLDYLGLPADGVPPAPAEPKTIPAFELIADFIARHG